MWDWVLKKIIGTKNERTLKKIEPFVREINALEPGLALKSDAELKQASASLRERARNGESAETLLVESFALVREASKRVLGMRPFDVQLLGGVVLHQGKIAEMKTGEGKTLVATLPVYLNALSGKGVHVVTVNDYLARRDAEWMGKVYRFLGLSVGCIQHGLSDEERRRVYAGDVVYATNNELGFDYLRDNMKFRLEEYAQRDFHYAIVDEVDSILIDEARTPLIISGPAEESTEVYYVVDKVIPKLSKEKDCTVDEKHRQVMLTEEGVHKVEQLLGVENLYEPAHFDLVHHVMQALKAHVLFKRDVDYVVKDGEVVIVDEFTGRLMPGRRYSDGLHQALEAKERLRVASENQTLATITFQNFFRIYPKLAGMTGTAETEASEFHKIYNLDVVVIPPNRQMIRTDHPDIVYKTQAEKFKAVVGEIKELHEKGRPVLVGTISIEKSELLSQMLKHQGIPHSVLNAKHHEREAEIIAQAGRKSTVTISTNMAGRGTDILLGGNPEFLAAQLLRERGEEGPPSEALVNECLALARHTCEQEKQEVITLGGLHILGTERHEARRIDNQLRGRAGRQGDPGSSRFYLSLEDDLLRIFGSERIAKLMERLGIEEDEPIEHSWITKAIENAQKRVEARNFDIRKHLLEYDNVMNRQREIVYSKRRHILSRETITEDIVEMLEDLGEDLLETYVFTKRTPAPEDFREMVAAASQVLKQEFQLDPGELSGLEKTELRVRLLEGLKAMYEAKSRAVGPLMPSIEKLILLSSLDALWKDHLLAMDHLKEGIGLRGYGQKDPLVEYQKEAYALFVDMMLRLREQVLGYLFAVELREEGQIEEAQAKKEHQASAQRMRTNLEPEPVAVRRDGRKVGRNDPCPCGSGKKYKKCHGLGS
ncbi:MAG: preprotein translocase subunit SecA [Nitrospirota bacterium]|nr:preprotein translocase subunit SecA [Nitrospirota bacterium]